MASRKDGRKKEKRRWVQMPLRNSAVRTQVASASRYYEAGKGKNKRRSQTPQERDASADAGAEGEGRKEGKSRK